jgi:hypothetical protein
MNTCLHEHGHAQGVSFDLRERVGTCFVLVDSLAGGVLGLLSSGTSHYDALRLMSQSFEFIQEQVLHAWLHLLVC